MIRVAAYCRVSTEKDDQINSLESQKRYFTEYISRNPHWRLTEIYVDEGITGTSTKKRHAFLKMLKDARNHKFDLILTKEISRFARNTLDSIYYTRILKNLNIGVIFVNDNINTLDGDAELRLTIMASIAQEESRKTSERVKWGQKRSMERGVVFGRDLLGFHVHNGKLYINEEGAKIVRLIFHKFVKEGKGTHVIAKELMEAGIPPMSGSKWYGTVILRILKNEKYCGDLVQKKTYTPDYLKQEKKYNRGEEELICINNHHEGIISRELFEEAQAILQQRRKDQVECRKYSNRYCFSGLIRCGACGHSYVSRTRKKKDGTAYRYWRCYEAVQHGTLKKCKGCDSPTLREEDIKDVLRCIIGNLKINRQEIIKYIEKILKKFTDNDEDFESELTRAQSKINYYTVKKQELIDLYLSKEISKEDFQQVKHKYELEVSQWKKVYEDILRKQSILSKQSMISQKSILNKQSILNEQSILNKQSMLSKQTISSEEAYFCNQTNRELETPNDNDINNERIESENRITFMDQVLKGLVWSDAFYSNIMKQVVVEKSQKKSIQLRVYLKNLDNGLVCEIKR